MTQQTKMVDDVFVPKDKEPNIIPKLAQRWCPRLESISQLLMPLLASGHGLSTTSL